MAYTFGGATSDKIAYTGMPSAPFTANTVGLCCCWVRPTTLTVGRVLWAAGAVSGLFVGTVTSDVELAMDAVTADYNIVFPAGLTTNTWKFVAVLWNQGASTVANSKCWVGTETTGPVEVTGSVNSPPSGAWTGSGTSFTVGNTSGSVAFQGDIGGVVTFVDALNDNRNTICSIAANGALSQGQTDQVLRSLVTPMWRGDIASVAGFGRKVYRSGPIGFAFSASLDNSVAGGAWRLSSSAPSLGTITGATASIRRTPRSFDDQPNNQVSRRRGGLLVVA